MQKIFKTMETTDLYKKFVDNSQKYKHMYRVSRHDS